MLNLTALGYVFHFTLNGRFVKDMHPVLNSLKGLSKIILNIAQSLEMTVMQMWDENRNSTVAIISQRMKGDETDWCTEGKLHLDVNKSKELIIDFRKLRVNHKPSSIYGIVLDRTAILSFGPSTAPGV